MPGASYAVSNFLGGEVSQFAQGRFDKPDYHFSLKACLNALPVEIGPWSRRPGTQHAGITRLGGAARVIKFDFEQANAVTAEFSDSFVRFRYGPALITTNDSQVVIAVSTANPAVVQTTAATNWATGNTLIFSAPSTPLLENRQFTATKIDTTHFSLADAITGANIDGSTLGALAAGAAISRVQELATVYNGASWSGIRAVQAETTDLLLTAANPPQALTVPTMPSPGVNPVFSLAAATFNDGPYLDPFINGVEATPSAKLGIIGITLAFPAYSAATSYPIGVFVTSSSVNYVSLVDQNVGNTPASSPIQWAPTSGNAAINGGQGFLGTDIGRLVRLFSEPALWSITTNYVAGNIVSYNPSGLAGATTYWQSLTINTGDAPGSDLTNWEIIPQGAAIWTWGRITSLSNIIDRALTGSASIGSMTGAGGSGINAVFNGIFAQVSTAGAAQQVVNSVGLSTNVSFFSYVGKNYSGASNQKIQQATIYPSTDHGFGYGIYTDGSGTHFSVPTFTFNLRGKASAPSGSSDGTLLGSVTSPNTYNPITIISNDQNTTWAYVWVEIKNTFLVVGSYTLNSFVGQLSFFNPPGTGVSSGVNVEILGPPLLYTVPITTWRLGAYSNTTGWPTCGVYYEGRIWLGGAISNRFDACVSNGINGGTVNFAPTDQYGVVAASAGISYTLNSDSVNPIFWFEPDLQGIIVGTQAGEFLIQAPTTGPLAPTNIAARRVTKIGCANIEPRRTEHTTTFVQRYTKKLMEYFPDVFSGKFSAPNLADKAQHIVRAGIAELAYTSAATPILWGRDALGALFGITYKRDSLASSQPPTFYGWHRHALGSGRTVQSICGGPSVGGNLDTLTMATIDPATGVYHVELLTDAMDEQSPLSASWFLDDAVKPTSTSTTNAASAGAPYGGLTINGLWHLNGKTVQVFAGGLDCGDRGLGPTSFTDFTVANGSIFVPYGDTISAGSGRGLFTAAFAATAQIVVGFTFTSQGQLVKPISQAETGALNGPAFGKKSRVHRYAAKVVNSLGLSFGTNFTKMFPAKFTKADDITALPPLTTFSGILQDSLQDDYGYEHAICWQVTRPWPANIAAIGGNLETQDQ